MLHPLGAGDWRPVGLVTLAGSFDESPITGRSLDHPDVDPVPCLIVHGTADPVVPIGRSRRFASLLTGRGWPVRSLEPETDHAGVIGTEYRPGLGRCIPTGDPGAQLAVQAAAGEMARLWSPV